MSDNRELGSNFLRDLTDAASRNPLSAALIGMGAVWILGERVWQGVRPVMEQAPDLVGAAAARLRPNGGRGYARSDDLPALTELFRQQPLALGVLGVAIGAGLAAALPSTRMESELLGESSAELKATARDLARQQTERVQDAAERALHAAADEAERQGLTPEGLKSAKDSVAAKLGNVLDAANEGVRKGGGQPSEVSPAR